MVRSNGVPLAAQVRRGVLGCAAVSVLVLSGCSVKMTPLTEAELVSTTAADRLQARERMPALGESLTLEEAVARALKYNLEHRTRMLEQSLAFGQLEAGRFDMLPRFMADAGYISRSKDAIRNSIDSVTGQPSLANPSISSERSFGTFDVGLTWNLLDFGASYYTAKQNADRVLIASERRRKAMHTLIQNVRTAYWRAVAAERLSDTVRATIAEAERALADSRRISSQQVRSPGEAWRYQRTLLENLRLLEGVDRELAAARIELAGLIGVAPGTPIRLQEPTEPHLLDLDYPVERMEELALLNNADLREHFYNVRIAADETRKALLRLLPGVTLSYVYKYDNDSYRINQEWTEAGVRVSYNLFNILAAPSRMRASEAGEQVAEARRMALQMSLLTQVHLARHQYHDAMRQYRRADEIFEVDNNLARFAADRAQSQMGSQLDNISANVTHILSSVRRYHALARVHEAASRIQATLGLEPKIGSVDEIELAALTELVAASLQQWSQDGAAEEAVQQ
jgi:outer membrane protein TolC